MRVFNKKLSRYAFLPQRHCNTAPLAMRWLWRSASVICDDEVRDMGRLSPNYFLSGMFSSSCRDCQSNPKPMACLDGLESKYAEVTDILRFWRLRALSPLIC
jgi:hypothetical protein